MDYKLFVYKDNVFGYLLLILPFLKKIKQNSMKNKLYLFVFLLQVLALSVHAARVDTVFVKSPSMNREVKVVYILPDKAVAGIRKLVR